MQYCRQYSQATCSHGVACRHIHDPRGEQQAPPLPSMPQGRCSAPDPSQCSAGDACPFLHDPRPAVARQPTAEPCRRFASVRGCGMAECTSAHDDRIVPKVCQVFARAGTCRHGAHCRLVHDRRFVPSSSWHTSGQRPSAGTAPQRPRHDDPKPRTGNGGAAPTAAPARPAPGASNAPGTGRGTTNAASGTETAATTTTAPDTGATTPTTATATTNTSPARSTVSNSRRVVPRDPRRRAQVAALLASPDSPVTSISKGSTSRAHRPRGGAASDASPLNSAFAVPSVFEPCRRYTGGKSCGDACRYVHDSRGELSAPRGRVCRDHVSGRSCAIGSSCPYYHDDRATPAVVEPCREFASRSTCHRGADCRFGHDVRDSAGYHATGATEQAMCHDYTTNDGCTYGPQCRRVHDVRFRPGSQLNTPTLCAQWRGGTSASTSCDRGASCQFVHDARGTAAEGNPAAAAAALAMCRNQKGDDGCLKGDRCPFLHDVRHERMRAPQKEVSTCRNFSTVYGCRRGGWCRFLHDSRVVVEECSRFAVGRCSDDGCGFIHDERRQPAAAAVAAAAAAAATAAADSCVDAMLSASPEYATGGCEANTPVTAIEAAPRMAAPVTVVTIVRHGERVDAVLGAPTDPSGDPPLTPDGFTASEVAAADIITEVRALAETIEVGAGARPVRVELSVSPFRRCLQTAEGILSGLAQLKDVSVAGVVVDAQLGEVYCADVIKGLAPHLALSGPLLRTANWVEFTGINGIPPPSYVGPPITFGEARAVAHSRFRRAVGEHASAPVSLWDRPFLSLRLLVTHGDALQAIGELLRPAQVVYAAEYLGRIHVAQLSSQPMVDRDFAASKMVLVQSFAE